MKNMGWKNVLIHNMLNIKRGVSMFIPRLKREDPKKIV